MSNLKKGFRILRSMKFGIVLLALLGALSIIGSIVPQGREIEFYRSNFSEMKANLILGFNFNNLYKSFYFIGLFTLLSINLTLCSIMGFGVIVKKMKSLPIATKEHLVDTLSFREKEEVEGYIKNYFQSLGFKRVREKKDSTTKVYFSKKKNIGYMGSWMIHLGFLIVIIFYGYGQYTQLSTAIYGVPGGRMAVEGTDYIAVINDFQIEYRQDGSVKQYYTKMKLVDHQNQVLKQQEIFVNNPLSYNGYSFYQTATGWAANISFSKGDKAKNDLVYEGTFFVDKDGEVALQLNKFFPDFVATEQGVFSKSPQLNNPKFLYSLFENGRRVDMNVVSPGEVIEWENCSIVLDQPQMYTYLQVNRMKGKVGAAIGAGLVMVGLILAFYFKPSTLVIKRCGNNLHIYGKNIDEKVSHFNVNHQIQL